MASPTQWTWVWVSSGRWWKTGKPGVLQSMGLQRVRHNWATEQQERLWASQVAPVVKNLPANAGDLRDVGLIPGLGRSPGGGVATHSSILAWRIPWTEEPGRLWSIGSQRVRHAGSDLHKVLLLTSFKWTFKDSFEENWAKIVSVFFRWEGWSRDYYTVNSRQTGICY